MSRARTLPPPARARGGRRAPPPPPPAPWFRRLWTDRRLRRRTVRGLLALVPLVLALLVWRLIVSPASATPTAADAIVVLAGTEDRIARGQVLLEAGVSSRLVVVGEGSDIDLPALCDAPRVGVTCVQPEERSVRGQVRAAATAIESGGAKSLVLVTSRHQLSRARLQFARCSGQSLTVVGTTPPDAHPGRWLDWIASETPKLTRTIFDDSGC